MRNLFVAILSTVFFLGGTQTVHAEYPAIEAAIQAQMLELVPALSGKTILVSIDESLEMKIGWRLAAAIETEVVSQLLKNDVHATDDDSDHRFSWLAGGKNNSIQRWRRDPVYDLLLVGKLHPNGRELIIEIRIFDPSESEPVAETELELTAKDAAIDANTPDVSLDVIGFVSQHRGRAIGNGTCWTAAKDALASAGAKRIGLYDYGRQLGPGEAVLPGDILQFEKVKLRGRVHKKGTSFGHHTAIVSEVTGRDSVKILHQNYGRQRDRIVESSIQLDEVVGGTLLIFRPVIDPPVLPRSPLPWRKGDARVVRDSNGRIDLLRSCDPDLDTVRGIWVRDGNRLVNNKDVAVRMQIPVDVPEAYILRGKIKRIFAENGYVIVLVVDGRQAVLTMDGFAGYKTTGLGVIDGKRENNNETTHTGKIFPMNELVEIEVTVTKNSVRFVADGKTIVDWTGEASRLTMTMTWAVPNKNWLALGCYMAVFETSDLTLEEIEE